MKVLMQMRARWLTAVVVVMSFFAVSARAWAQGCAMCYNSAAAGSTSSIQALQRGIVVLLIPPLAMFLGIFALAFHRRNRFHGNADPLSALVRTEASKDLLE